MFRHCEEHSDEAIHSYQTIQWIATSCIVRRSKWSTGPFCSLCEPLLTFAMTIEIQFNFTPFGARSVESACEPITSPKGPAEIGT